MQETFFSFGTENKNIAITVESFAFLYPVSLFLSLTPNNNQGSQKDFLYRQWNTD